MLFCLNSSSQKRVGSFQLAVVVFWRPELRNARAVLLVAGVASGGCAGDRWPSFHHHQSDLILPVVNSSLAAGCVLVFVPLSGPLGATREPSEEKEFWFERKNVLGPPPLALRARPKAEGIWESGAGPSNGPPIASQKRRRYSNLVLLIQLFIIIARGGELGSISRSFARCWAQPDSLGALLLLRPKHEPK